MRNETQDKQIQILDPWYVTGFVDGEGCFSLFINTEKKRRKNGNIVAYKYWVTTFSIRLREDDVKILEALKKHFGCGTIGGSKNYNSLQYTVKSRKELIEKVIPHFDSYPCRAKKDEDYNLWKRAVNIIWNCDLTKKQSTNPAAPLVIGESEENELVHIRELLSNRLTGSKFSNAHKKTETRMGKRMLKGI